MKTKILGYDTVLTGYLTDLSGKIIASIFRVLFDFRSTQPHISEDFNLQTALNNFTRSYIWTGQP